MQYIWQKFKNECQKFLEKQGIDSKGIILEVPPDDIAGDLAFPCFGLSKQRKKSPADIALEIDKSFKQSQNFLIGQVINVGPYVNFLVNKELFTESLMQEMKNCRDFYGSLPVKNKKVGIEYVQPNTNKALSIGHARNASLGHSMSEILKFAGYEVIKINLFNDRGTHICKSMLAYQKWGNGSTPERQGLKPDHFVGKYYVMFTKKAEDDPGLEEEAQAMLKKWEEGDKNTVELWKKMNNWFYAGVEETFRRYGISYDKIYYESDIYQEGKGIVAKALEQGHCYKLDDGAIEVNLEDVNLDKKILQRRDGTSVYIVQDLFLAKKKFADLDLDLSVYVVADEQKYHFDVLFELLDRFEIVPRDKNYHLTYGMVNLQDGKMSSRRGTVVKMDDLLDELHQLAREQVLSRDEKIDNKELAIRAEKIGQAAMKFNLLNQDKNRVLVFNQKEAVKFEGETGPYLLYTYARIKSVLAKSEIDITKIKQLKGDYLQNDEFIRIIVLMSRLSEVIDRTAREYNPAMLTKYLFNLSSMYNHFYHNYRILDARSIVDQQSGLIISSLVAQILSIGLKLVGIEPVEKM